MRHQIVMNELCLNLLAPFFKLCTILLVLTSHTNFKLMISQERMRISIVKYLVQDKTLVSCNLGLELSLMWIGFWFFFNVWRGLFSWCDFGVSFFQFQKKSSPNHMNPSSKHTKQWFFYDVLSTREWIGWIY